MTVWGRRSAVARAGLCIGLAKVALIQLLGPSKPTLAWSALATSVLIVKALLSESKSTSLAAGNFTCVS